MVQLPGFNLLGRSLTQLMDQQFRIVQWKTVTSVPPPPHRSCGSTDRWFSLHGPLSTCKFVLISCLVTCLRFLLGCHVLLVNSVIIVWSVWLVCLSSCALISFSWSSSPVYNLPQDLSVLFTYWLYELGFLWLWEQSKNKYQVWLTSGAMSLRPSLNVTLILCPERRGQLLHFS